MINLLRQYSLKHWITTCVIGFVMSSTSVMGFMINDVQRTSVTMGDKTFAFSQHLNIPSVEITANPSATLFTLEFALDEALQWELEYDVWTGPVQGSGPIRNAIGVIDAVNKVEKFG